LKEVAEEAAIDVFFVFDGGEEVGVFRSLREELGEGADLFGEFGGDGMFVDAAIEDADELLFGFVAAASDGVEDFVTVGDIVVVLWEVFLVVVAGELGEEDRMAVLDVNIVIELATDGTSAFFLQCFKGALGAIVASVAEEAGLGAGELVGDGLLTLYRPLLTIVVEGVENRHLTWVKLTSLTPQEANSTTREALCRRKSIRDRRV
jgi:hypothetical protein